jgi:outer membrane immunogenic protein
MRRTGLAVAAAISIGIVGLALLPIAPASAASPAPAPTAFNWSGWYAGATAGWGWRSTTAYPPTSYYQSLGGDFSGGGYGTGGGGTRNNGFETSVGFGYNYQLANKLVWGVDYEFMRASLANNPQLGTAALKSGNNIYNASNFDTTDGDSNKWYGMLKAKFGYPVYDRVLPYVTGGTVYRMSYKTNDPTVTTITTSGGAFDIYGNPLPGTNGTSTTTTRTYTGYNRARAWGWVLGAGVNYAVTDSIFLKAEYLHLDFGHDTYLDPVASALTGGIVTHPYKRSAEIVRLGLDYRFYGGGGY